MRMRPQAAARGLAFFTTSSAGHQGIAMNVTCI